MRTNLIAGLLTAVVLLGIDPVARAQWAERREAVIHMVDVMALPFRLAWLAARPPDAALLMPVAGAAVNRVADSWGAPRPGGRTHQGQDIFARRGTAVFSATGGYVVRVGRTPRGGNVIVIAGAGGRRYYYAHLEACAPGMRVGRPVTPETVIGYVGTTGNAVHAPPHLHFALYTRAGAVNPLPLLRDRVPSFSTGRSGVALTEGASLSSRVWREAFAGGCEMRQRLRERRAGSNTSGRARHAGRGGAAIRSTTRGACCLPAWARRWTIGRGLHPGEIPRTHTDQRPDRDGGGL